MDLLIELLFILLIVIIIIIIFSYKILNNKYQIYIIKLDKAYSKINKNLHKKYDLLLKEIDFLNKKAPIDEDLLQEFLNTNLKKVETYDLNNTLIETDLLIQKHLSNNEKIINDKNFSEIKKDNDELDVIINSAKQYYNSNVKEFNSLIKKFPTSFIAKIKKYEIKKKLKELEKKELKILNK